MMTTFLNTKKLCIIYFLFLIMFFIALSGQKTLIMVWHAEYLSKSLKIVLAFLSIQSRISFELRSWIKSPSRYHDSLKLEAKQNFKDVFNLQPQRGSSVGNVSKDKPMPDHYAGIHHLPSDATTFLGETLLYIGSLFLFVLQRFHYSKTSTRT